MILAVVTGSRTWTERKAITDRLDALEATGELACVIEGGAKGADRIAGQWAAQARRRDIGWVRFDAAWRQNGVYNPHAGKGRNVEMARWAAQARDRLGWEVRVLAFQDGDSPGTAHMVRTCKELGLQGTVIRNPGS